MEDWIFQHGQSKFITVIDINCDITGPAPIPEFTACNRSMGVGICLDGSCFDLTKTCDGWPDCFNDGFDEMACK